jgi:hypothetical protein
LGFFSIPVYSGEDKPIIFSKELFFRNKRGKACAFDATQKLAAKGYRVGNDYRLQKERKVVIPGHSEIVDLKFFSGDENQSILMGLEFGKHGLRSARSGFYDLLFIKNIAGRGQLGGKGHGRIQKNGDQKDAQENE